MRFKQIRALLKDLMEIYDPATIARKERTHRPLFQKTVIAPSQSSYDSITQALLNEALRKTKRP